MSTAEDGLPTTLINELEDIIVEAIQAVNVKDDEQHVQCCHSLGKLAIDLRIFKLEILQNVFKLLLLVYPHLLAVDEIDSIFEYVLSDELPGNTGEQPLLSDALRTIHVH